MRPRRRPGAPRRRPRRRRGGGARRRTPPSINEDAKRFAGQLQEEILTRLHRESAKLDELFDAQSFR